MLKGMSNAMTLVMVLLVGILALGGFAAYSQMSVTRAPTTAVTYDGEFDDGFLATDGWFTTSFTEATDCNITNDVLGSDWSTCIYSTNTALNATANPEMNDHDLYFPFVIDIDGPVKSMDIKYEMGAGTATTGAPEDDINLMDAKLYTHEDNPKLIYDLKPYIEDTVDLDAKNLNMLGFSNGDEYVIWLKFHTKTINPAFTSGDDIGRLTVELDTEGDVDEAEITIQSA